MIRVKGFSCLNLSRSTGNASKMFLLQSLSDHIKIYPDAYELHIHYNGHATVRSQKEKAGYWICKDSEYIKIEDILETIKGATTHRKDYL